MKSTASSTRLRALRDRHDVAAGEGGDLAGFDAGQQRDAEVHVRVLVLGQRDVEVAGAHHADLARTEAQVEGFAVLGAGVLVDVAGLDHVARPLQHLLDAIAN